MRTERATYRASRVVLAPGSWLGPLAATLGLDLPLTVLKEQLSHFEPVDPAQFAPGRFPLFIQRFPGSRTYGAGFPIYGEPLGVKLLIDRLGPVVTPDDPDRSIESDILERLERYVAETVRGLTGRVAPDHELPLHHDARRGLHPRHPSGAPADRDRLPLLGSRLQVRDRDRADPRGARPRAAAWP